MLLYLHLIRYKGFMLDQDYSLFEKKKKEERKLEQKGLEMWREVIRQIGDRAGTRTQAF